MTVDALPFDQIYEITDYVFYLHTTKFSCTAQEALRESTGHASQNNQAYVTLSGSG